MSELGKVEECLDVDMNFYLLPCKAKTGFVFRQITTETAGMIPVEIRSSIIEAGRDYRTCLIVVHCMKYG
jgi:hypothetical protein